MANPLVKVKPGDLIASADWNDMVDAWSVLDARVTALEGGTTGTALAITGLIPFLGPYRIGDTLTVLGRNFEFLTGGTRVFLNGVRVLTFGTASTDTQLVFTIPPVPGVTEPGTSVTLRVSNSSGQEDTREIVLRPAAVILFGDVDVIWLAVSPTTIQPDQPATFQYRIRSRASAEADFLIDPVIAVAANQSVWQGRLQVLDGSLNPLSGRLIHLTPTQEAVFHVRITSVPSGTAGVNAELSVTASSGGVTGTSGAIAFQVGQPMETPDVTITLTPTGLIGPGTLVGDTLTLAASASTRVRFLLTVQTVGIYDLTLTSPAGGSGWTAAPFATPPQYNIQAGDVVGGIAQRFPTFTVQTAATPNASATMTVRYQRQGATNSRSFPLNLSLGS